MRFPVAIGLVVGFLGSRADCAQETTPEEWSAFVQGYGGFWFTGTFSAVTPQGGRKIQKEALAEAGLEFGVRYDWLYLSLSACHDGSSDVRAYLGGVHVGTVWEPEEGEWIVPDQLRVSVGLIGGDYQVRETGFGNFEFALGFQARTTTLWDLSEWLNVGLWMDFRYISFDYDGTVLSGDGETVGASVAVGLSVGFRF